MLEPFKSLARIKYFPETDTMYLTGYTNERPHIGKEWGTVGTEIVRYDNWSQSRNIRWRLTLPYQPSDHPDPAAKNFLVIKAIDIAGDRIFAIRVLQAEVYVYDTATGTSIAKLKPGIEVGRESGWVDIPYGLRAYQRANGEYVVFVEEDAKAKVIMYRLEQR